MRNFLCILLAVSSCVSAEDGAGVRVQGDMEVKTFTLTHPSGLSATVSNLGATLRALSTPDREGKVENILVGCKTDEEWLKNPSYFGSTVGRYANRIAGGEFTLDGRTYNLAKNNGANHLHGGIRGFDKVIWESEVIGEDSVKFTYVSKDGEEGYPGNLEISVEYSLSEDALTWEAIASTDKATPVNLTNHAYFNLSGDPSANVLDQLLRIRSENYLPVDDTLIPTGEVKDVTGTPFDFREAATIGDHLKKMNGSYDHTFVLRPEKGTTATLSDPKSGRSMVLTTNQPGVQFYLASPHGKKFSALCLEPQKFPDSPNQPSFPSSTLQAGETYSHVIEFRFPKP